MTYKQKLTALSSIIAALALAYALSLIFDPERAGSRSDAYTWLDPKLVEKIDRISIANNGETKELLRKNNEWFAARNGTEYPAKKTRIEDFIGLLTAKAPYPVRSSGADSHERLGLTESAASRIIVSGGAGPLLDLLVGAADSSGRGVYLRRQGQNETRSGEDKFSAYTGGALNSWYNLRLIPESANGLDIDGVQRLSVYVEGQEPEVFSRWNKEWAISGITVANPDMARVDGYIRTVLNTEGDDFADSAGIDASLLNHSRIVLELGSGKVLTIRLSAPGENNSRYAHVSDTAYIYSLSGWAAERLFKTAADFEKQ